MTSLVAAVFHLLARAFSSTLNIMGYSPVALAGQLVTFCCIFAYLFWSRGWPAIKEKWGEDGLIGVAVISALWAMVFVEQTGSIIYNDHASLRQEIYGQNGYKAQITALKSDAVGSNDVSSSATNNQQQSTPNPTSRIIMDGVTASDNGGAGIDIEGNMSGNLSNITTDNNKGPGIKIKSP